MSVIWPEEGGGRPAAAATAGRCPNCENRCGAGGPISRLGKLVLAACKNAFSSSVGALGHGQASNVAYLIGVDALSLFLCGGAGGIVCMRSEAAPIVRAGAHRAASPPRRFRPPPPPPATAAGESRGGHLALNVMSACENKTPTSGKILFPVVQMAALRGYFQSAKVAEEQAVEIAAVLAPGGLPRSRRAHQLGAELKLPRAAGRASEVQLLCKLHEQRVPGIGAPPAPPTSWPTAWNGPCIIVDFPGAGIADESREGRDHDHALWSFSARRRRAQ
uniref:Uncharacterized protein n=1 Tax=Oryza sativa subsp. japonica TaxID=39947 RepID=Q654Z7_ORYSJ|nr:hypothetical protein [Oryza sativa Japonica Group]